MGFEPMTCAIPVRFFGCCGAFYIMWGISTKEGLSMEAVGTIHKGCTHGVPGRVLCMGGVGGGMGRFMGFYGTFNMS